MTCFGETEFFKGRLKSLDARKGDDVGNNCDGMGDRTGQGQGVTNYTFVEFLQPF